MRWRSPVTAAGGVDERKGKWGVRTFPCRPCACAFPFCGPLMTGCCGVSDRRSGSRNDPLFFPLFPHSKIHKNQSLQEKNPTFQNLGLIFRPKNQNFPFPTCPRHTTSPIFGPPCPNFLDPLPHSLKIAPAVLLASCAWDADGEIDEEDEEEHNNTKKRQRLLLAATLRRRAAASSHGRQPGQPGFLLSGERV